MKRLLIAAALAAVAATAVVDTADAARYNPRTGVLCSSANPCRSFNRNRRGSTTIVQPQAFGLGGSGLDLNTLLLLGLGGGTQTAGFGALAAPSGLGILPLLLGSQLLAPQVIIEERGGRRHRRSR